jgi:anti-anti-sigma regulatory factor
VTLAINLELSPGRSGASARVELHLGEAGAAAVVRVRGRLEENALRRLAQTLEDLGARGVRQLLLDCSELRDISRETVSSLIGALARFESVTGPIDVCGLPPRLRDHFRSVEHWNGLHPWTSVGERALLPAPRRLPREWPS